MHDPAQDYAAADMDIVPVADPNSVTKMQQAAKAQFLLGLAEAGLVDPGAASKRMLEAMDIEDREDLAPQADPEAEAMQRQMAEMQMQLEAQKVNADTQKAAADQMKAEAEMIKAQTPVDTSADMARAASDERVKMAQIEADMQIEREKMAQEATLKREEMMASLNAKRLEVEAQLLARGEGDGASTAQIAQIQDGFTALIQTIQAQIEMANAPKRVVRDENGQGLD